MRRRLDPKQVSALLENQRGRCYYCNIKFDSSKYRRHTVDHVKPYMYFGDNVPKVLCCHRCNVLKGNLSEEQYRAGFVCVNVKPSYDGQSYMEAVKYRNPIRWHQRMFPSVFWWNKYNPNYKLTIRLYEGRRY